MRFLSEADRQAAALSAIKLVTDDEFVVQQVDVIQPHREVTGTNANRHFIDSGVRIITIIGNVPPDEAIHKVPREMDTIGEGLEMEE